MDSVPGLTALFCSWQAPLKSTMPMPPHRSKSPPIRHIPAPRTTLPISKHKYKLLISLYAGIEKFIPTIRAGLTPRSARKPPSSFGLQNSPLSLLALENLWRIGSGTSNVQFLAALYLNVKHIRERPCVTYHARWSYFHFVLITLADFLLTGNLY